MIGIAGAERPCYLPAYASLPPYANANQILSQLWEHIRS